MYPANHNSDGQAGDGAWEENQAAASQLMSQEGVFQLTQDLRKFSETLSGLKSVFCEEKDGLEQSLRVAAHERLGELLKVLKTIVNKYTELNSTGILNAAENLINHIKNFNYESEEEVVPPEIFSAINNLALAFSSSVSECLIGDINISPRQSMVQSQSYEHLPQHPGHQRQTSVPFDPVPEIYTVESTTAIDSMGPLATSETVAAVLSHVTENLDICFERAKAWSKYANDLITYVKKRAHIELEYSKQLTKLSQTTRTALSEQSFLPFQSLYCTALDNDKEYATNLITTYQNFILAHKFIEPLHARRLEHDRQHKQLRELWRKDKRRLEEAEVNLKKAKQTYQTKNQEYQKAKEASIRADQQQQIAAASGDLQHNRQGSNSGSNPLNLGSVGGSALTALPTSKLEKKKRQEDDSYLKATQAEHYYRACVNEANHRRKELERKEEQYLKTLRELMTQCDQTTKTVTLSFFQLHCDLVSPLRVQFQALLDESKGYEPGFQYAEYLKHVTPQHTTGRIDYQFEPYTMEGAAYMETAGARAEMAPPDDSSPLSGRSSQTGRFSSAARRASHNRGTGFSDTESSSSRSLDDISPSASPGDPPNRKDIYRRRPSTEGSLSSEEILDDTQKENQETGRLAPPQTADHNALSSWSPESSPAPPRSQFPKVMKVVREAFKGMKRNTKPTIFGVEFSVAAQESPDGVPYLIKKCIAEIDNRALTVKGIYRVNGVKNRVEKLCALLDTPQCVKMDLSEHLPHDVSGVLKYFLRQLPEPLLLYRHYNEFLDVAKDYAEFLKESKLQGQTTDRNGLEDERAQSLLDQEQKERSERLLQGSLDKMRAVVEKLPEENRNTLQYIVAHLSRVVEHQSTNKMTASNLAIIFGPTLLRPVQEAGKELQSLIELPNQSQAIEMLITYRNRIFDTYSHQAHTEEMKDHYKTPNSTDEPLQLENYDGASSPTIKLPSQSSQSQPSTLSSASSGEVPASSEQVHLLIEDHSHSTIGTSSSGDTLLSGASDDAESRQRQKNSFSADSSQTEQSNGGMNVIDDWGEIFPHSIGIKRSSSSCDVVPGDGFSSNREELTSHDDLSLRLPSSAAASALGPTGRRPRPVSLSPTGARNSSGRASQVSERQHSSERSAPSSSPSKVSKPRGRGPGEELPKHGQDNTPVAPARLKSKSKRLSKTAAGAESLGSPENDQKFPLRKPVSPHRPRSRRVSDYLAGAARELDLEMRDVENDNQKARRISMIHPPKSELAMETKSKRHSTLATLIHPIAYKPQDDQKSRHGGGGTARRLPQIPSSKNKESPTRFRPVNMPGRTPPFNKTQTWSFAKSEVLATDQPPEGRELRIRDGVQKKILTEEDHDEEVSFC